MGAREFRDPPERTLEDFTAGDVIITRGRTVEAADFVTFAGLTGDYYPLHIDEEYGRDTRFGTRIAHGPLTFTIAIGLMGLNGYYGNAVVALLEVQSIKALKPVVAGDTITVRAEVTAAEPAENPRYGELSVSYSVRNQRGDEVMTFRQTMLVRRAIGNENK
jgi:3-hydroxybutyryl-CoA dehydratase